MGIWVNASTIHCCYNCTERYPACHDHCERYLQEKAEYHKATSTINKAKAATRDIDNHHFNAVVRNYKVNAKKGKR